MKISRNEFSYKIALSSKNNTDEFVLILYFISLEMNFIEKKQILWSWVLLKNRMKFPVFLKLSEKIWTSFETLNKNFTFKFSFKIQKSMDTLGN